MKFLVDSSVEHACKDFVLLDEFTKSLLDFGKSCWVWDVLLSNDELEDGFVGSNSVHEVRLHDDSGLLFEKFFEFYFILITCCAFDLEPFVLLIASVVSHHSRLKFLGIFLNGFRVKTINTLGEVIDLLLDIFINQVGESGILLFVLLCSDLL